MACCGKKEGIRYSIVIPTYNHLEDGLKPCLESLFQYTDMKDKEVVVVANGCTDGTEQYVQGLMMGDRIKLLSYPEPLGYAKACNAGIQACGGDYIVLLNNDTILLEQNIDDWINILAEPFLKAPYEKIGLSGPLKGYSEPADAMFLIFFVTMINKKLIEEIGLLSLEFGVGGGEDTEYCIRAERAGWKVMQVPEWSRPIAEKGFMVGPYPIYHKGELTVHDNPEWGKIFEENSWKLRYMFNERWSLSNNCERAVIGKDHEVPSRELNRYLWAANQIVGNKVLEIGCSSGYGLRFFHHRDIDYTGIDYDKGIIDYAIRNFGDLPGVKFIHADINIYPLEQYDTIIAFEVLEHLDNGREVAQRLKAHCKKLIFTTPYKEIPGMWGMHHKMHNITERDFPDFKYYYMYGNGEIVETPTDDDPQSLIMGVWEKEEEKIQDFIKEESNVLKGVLCEVLTKDRYHETLPLTLYAIAQQEAVPETIVIFDDSEKRQNLAEMPLYSYLFALLSNAGIEIKVELGGSRGVPFARNYILNKFGKNYNYIWRVDDDEAPDPDVLRSLYNTILMNHDIAAVGGSIISPHEYKSLPDGIYNNISTLKTAPNMQWFFNDKRMFHVEHLTSSFIFEIEKAKEVGGYNQNLSKAGHREETILTYSLYKQGWLLAYIPNTVTWHLRYPTGGIRSAGYDKEMYDHDEQVFEKFLSGKDKKEKYIVLDNGIGDHYMFKEVWPEIKEKHKDKKLIIATAYRGIIEDADEIISIAEAEKRLGKLDRFNVYGVCANKGFNMTIQNGYREMYL